MEDEEDKTKKNVISEFIHSLGSYAEYSPSGKGLHILCKGQLPPGGRRKGNFEFYENGRFFTVTGDIASEYTEIVDCTESIKYLHAKYIGSTESLENINEPGQVDLGLSEEKIIEIASNSKNGVAFKTLFDGHWEGLGFPSQSEADLSLANHLAFWTGRDYQKMDSIFRKSGLMRENWDGKRGPSTYGQGILNTAIRDCRDVFCPEEEYSISVNDKDIKMYAFDDTGNADRFIAEYEDRARFSYIDDAWYFYNGEKWEQDNLGNVKSLTEKVIRKMKLERTLYDDEDVEKAFDKHLKYTRNSSGKNNMLREAEHRLSILPSQFDRKKEFFNSKNGVVNLRNGELLGHDHEHYLSKISNVEYTDKIDCPNWITFLNDIFDGDQELIRYIQRAVGYSMTGSTREQCVFFCYGNGRNGKSTFLDVINEIMEIMLQMFRGRPSWLRGIKGEQTLM